MRYFIFGPVLVRLAIVGLALAVWAHAAPVAGQQIPKSLQNGGPDDPQRKTRSGWTVTIAASRDAVRFADELARALGDGNDLRVLPVISRGPVDSVEDLLKLPEIDIAITQADALEYFRTERKMALGTKIQYIAGLPTGELHVAARASIHALEDLRGRSVVMGPAGGAAAMTGAVFFRRLGIKVKPVFTDLPAGLELVKSGEAAALLTVESKPSDLWLNVPPDAGIHFLPVPYRKAFADLYVAGALTSADYPNLIRPDEQVDTIAVPGVLAVKNLPKNDDRLRRLVKFVVYLHTRWDKLKEPPFHRGWRDVDLAATAHGWTRFSAAEAFHQFNLWREAQ
jgi:TRAP-type uncharacterized transport system substrate-binding protein